MAIGSAIEKGHNVYVYDENGRQLSLISAGSFGPDDGLKGYRSSTVNIRRGSGPVVLMAHRTKLTIASIQASDAARRKNVPVTLSHVLAGFSRS
jgi:hypothetical protein